MFSSAVYAFELLFAVCRHQWAPSRECQAAMAQAQERQKELPHAQGKRHPSKTVGVASGLQRADTLKP